MENKEFLQKIWNLEAVRRPAVVVEEPIGYTPANLSFDIDDYEGWYQEAMAYYRSLRRDRDDNILALNTNMGTYVIPSAFGAETRRFSDGRRYIDRPVIYQAKDVDRIKPLPLMDTILGNQIKLVKYFESKAKGGVHIRIPDIQNPLGVAEMLWESNDFFISLLEEPSTVHKLLEIITEVLIDYISRLKKICPEMIPITWPGVWAPAEKGVHLSDDTMSMIAPEIYEEYGVRYNNIISREYGGIFLHSCTTNERYFESIIKNEGLRSINFAAQYSSDMEKIYGFFGGKAVILPHYVHTDSPQIGTLPEFVEKVLSCWTPDAPTVIYIVARPGGGNQQEVFDVLTRHGYRL